ncbi:uncharacterized protein LOC121879953 [Homarus americanus]|uniref:uncharacterized protein LOC121879953 n=1 Tax=Homarus americanus TaxID=6706 RepID=UPI001C467397|nr:uncharacterized protein LOC121879953 [Homarus americanus]
MDDMFGNSSSETVMEADLSRVLANINQDIADLQYHQLQRDPLQPHHHKTHTAARTTHAQQSQPLSATTNVAHIVNRPLFTKTYALPLSSPTLREDSTHLGNPLRMTCGSTVAHVPVITSVGMQVEGRGGPVPHPRSLHKAGGSGGALRHTQSAVVGRVCHSQTPRPRALSTGATTHYHNEMIQQQQHSHHQVHSQHEFYQRVQHEHSYVNLQPTHLHHQQKQPLQVQVHIEQQTGRPVSTYDNIQGSSTQVPHSSTPRPPQSAPPVLQATPAFPHILVSPTPHTTVPRYMNVPLLGSLSPAASHKEHSKAQVCGGSNSAPSTPGGGSRGKSQHLHHSYIELWSGAHEERDSLSDSECEELRRSFQEPQAPSHRPCAGYVEMSSPYVKSPQMTSPFNGSVLADLATKLASYAGHQPRNIFCPFCPRYFGYEKSLGSHIHKVHREELNAMVENRCGDIQLQFCPICQAQFFNTTVLPKHLIDFHRASVIEILEKNNCIMSDAVGIQCPFCVKKVPHGKTGEQVLLYHMQQLHLSDYENMVKAKFRPYNGGSHESLKSISSNDVSQLAPFQPGVTSTPGLSNKLGTMALTTDARRSVEALNLDMTWSSHGRTFRAPIPPQSPAEGKSQEEETQSNKQLPSSISKGILRHQSGLNRKPSVKRELRFSVPPVTSEEIFVPESPEQTTPERLTDNMQQQQQQNLQQQQQQNLQQQQQQNIQQPQQQNIQQSQQQNLQQPQQQQHQDVQNGSKRIIPIRVDSLSAADFMDLNEKSNGQRKRRRLGLGLRSRKAFKKKDKENTGEREISHLATGTGKIINGAKRRVTVTPHVTESDIVPTPATRIFRRPKPVAIPRVPQLQPSSDQVPALTGAENVPKHNDHQTSSEKEEIGSDASPFTNLKLYSPLRMFRCNSCRVKFCDNESLSGHIGSRHRGLLYLLRPQYGCGVCSARFFENKYLVKHCLQHHTSLLEIRSPRKHKITIYRFTQD